MFETCGVRCDVCGEFILGILPDDNIQFFHLAGIENELTAHIRTCVEPLKRACETNDHTLLPNGPIRRAFEKQAERENGQ